MARLSPLEAEKLSSLIGIHAQAAMDAGEAKGCVDQAEKDATLETAHAALCAYLTELQS
jgi:hypothetical protein